MWSCNFAFTKLIYDVLVQRKLASISTGVHLESQSGYYLQVLFLFALKSGRKLFLNTSIYLIHFKKDRYYQ